MDLKFSVIELSQSLNRCVPPTSKPGKRLAKNRDFVSNFFGTRGVLGRPRAVMK